MKTKANQAHRAVLCRADWWVPEGGDGRWEKWVKGVKKVFKKISLDDSMCTWVLQLGQHCLPNLNF